jgi:hypothetical protein
MATPFEYDHDDEAPVELAPWLSWPQCPICAQRRQARCSTCGYAADEFPLADYQELGASSSWPGPQRELHIADAEQEAVLLMCPRCEEAFRPRFYNRCAACGYEFSEGVRPDADDDEDLTARVVWTATALLALLAAICLYFGAVLRP